MHGEFGRWFVFAAKFAAFEIGDDQIVGSHHAFAESARSGEDAERIEADGDVAVTRGNEPALVEPVSGGANIRAVFGFRLLIAGRNVIGAHFNFWTSLEVPTSTNRAADAFRPGVRRVPRGHRFRTAKVRTEKLFSGVNPAQLERDGDAINRKHISGDAIIHAVSFGIPYPLIEAMLHNTS